MRTQNDTRAIKDMLCVHMVLSDVQFNDLKYEFISKRVWEIMWNQISWRGFYPIAFGKAMLVNGARLKTYLIKIALYSAAEEYSYEELEKDIFIGGVRSTNDEFWECEAKLWPYLANETVKPD
jgi:hypothetical protein